VVSSSTPTDSFFSYFFPQARSWVGFFLYAHVRLHRYSPALAVFLFARWLVCLHGTVLPHWLFFFLYVRVRLHDIVLAHAACFLYVRSSCFFASGAIVQLRDGVCCLAATARQRFASGAILLLIRGGK
jgi:hypothetical protein